MTPPFTLNNRILMLVASISEKLGHFQTLGTYYFLNCYQEIELEEDSALSGALI